MSDADTIESLAFYLSGSSHADWKRESPRVRDHYRAAATVRLGEHRILRGKGVPFWVCEATNEHGYRCMGEAGHDGEHVGRTGQWWTDEAKESDR